MDVAVLLSVFNLLWVMGYSLYVVHRVRQIHFYVLGEGLPLFARAFVEAVVSSGLGFARDTWSQIKRSLATGSVGSAMKEVEPDGPKEVP